MEIITIAIVGVLNVLCFMIGARVGQKIVKDEPIELQSVNPAEIIRKMHDKRDMEKEQSRIETILHNIDNYDGTGNGQKDV